MSSQHHSRVSLEAGLRPSSQWPEAGLTRERTTALTLPESNERRNLVGVEKPLVHCVTSDWLEAETREEADGEPGLAFSMIDARHVQSVSVLIEAFARAMNCPSSSGGNLDTSVKQSA
jgi:hypothetical protein